MPQDRLNRAEFSALLSQLDEDGLKKVLWTLYRQGTGPVRERIETLLGVPAPQPPPPDPQLVLDDVEHFAALARAGAYLGPDRRVSPKERTRWRFTFRDLTNSALQVLDSDDEQQVRVGVSALALMIDLAVDTHRVDYFRSEDPVEAARFVVSDVVRAMWLRTRAVSGTRAFAQQASAQLLRWESGYGWTRRGDGWVAARETSLAQVAAELLVTPDMWNEFAEEYTRALSATPDKGSGRGSRTVRRAHPADLREWHALLSERLLGSDREDLIAALTPRGAARDS